MHRDALASVLQQPPTPALCCEARCERRRDRSHGKGCAVDCDGHTIVNYEEHGNDSTDAVSRGDSLAGSAGAFWRPDQDSHEVFTLGQERCMEEAVRDAGERWRQ